MISRYNIIQNVIKQLREILKCTSLNKDLKGISFEYQQSEAAPIRLRCRLLSHQSKLKEQIGQSLTKEVWKLGKYDNFLDKFKYFLKLLKRVKPTIFNGWDVHQVNQLLDEAEKVAIQYAKTKMGAYFLFRPF